MRSRGGLDIREREPLIPPHGGFRRLRSFQVARLVYDVTVRFCDRYIDESSRTTDHMVQAARSGVQNIAEGSRASGTSKKMEMKLTNVARASLDELRLDYEDFLRHRNLPIWPREDPRRQELIDRRLKNADEVAAWVREVYERERQGRGGPGGPGGPAASAKTNDGPGGGSSASGAPGGAPTTPASTKSTGSTRSTQQGAPPTYPEIAANAALVLIAVASALLGRQVEAQAKAFEKNGGFTERLYRTRKRRRNRE